MAYTPQTWVDGPLGGTPVNAVRLGNMETGIANAASAADAAAATAAGKANASHTHTASQITDLIEVAQDMIASFIVAGANITSVYDDAANTLTISSTGGGTLDTEAAQDMISTFIVAGAGITKTYDDAGNTLTIAVNLSLATLPAGTVIFTNLATRPTTRTDLLCIFNGADPGSNALDGDLWFRST